MSSDARTWMARIAGGCGVALAIVGGVLLHFAFTHAFSLALALVLPLVLLAAVALIVLAAMRERVEAAQVQAELLAEIQEQADELIRQRDEAKLLESAVVHTRNGVLVIEAAPGRRVLYANDAFSRITGFAIGEVVGRPYVALEDPAESASRQGILQALDAGRLHQVELRSRRKDGTPYWADLSLIPIPGIDGAISHWVAIQHDATDRKRAEELLRANEERLRMLGDNIPDGAVYRIIAYSESKVQIVYISAGIERLLELTPEEVLANTDRVYQLIHPDDLPKVREAQAASHRGLTAFDVEFRSYTARGKLKWMHCRSMPRRQADGRIERCGIILDVTARKEVDERFRLNEERSRLIVESSPECVHLLAIDGALLEMNPAGLAMIEADSFEQVAGHCCYPLVAPEDREAYVAFNERVCRGEPGRMEFEIIGLKGTRRRLATTAAPLHGQGGAIAGQLAVTRDITGQAQTEAALRRSEELLQEARKQEAIGRLAGGIAHDFNNLLTGVLGNLSLIQMPPGNSNGPYLAAIDQAAGRAAELTRKLLGFARRNQLAPIPLHLNDTFAEIIQSIHSKLGSRVHISSGVAPGCGPVLADPALLREALLDLCQNACDAMTDGGALTLAAGPFTVASESHHRNPDAHPGAFIRISVADTGAGMTDDIRSRIFEPFFTTKEHGDTSGLGLAMVQGIVKQHGGWIECQSEPGAGTRFDLYLAAAPAPQAALPETTPSCSDTMMIPVTSEATLAEGDLALVQRRRTILLVDDEAMIRSLGSVVLERAGFDVVLAQDGMEAVEKFAQEAGRIDLIVMDMTMPRLSGREAYRQIARLAPGTRVLFSTGYTTEDVAGVEGSVGLLVKPYRPGDLVAAVTEALGAGSTRPEPEASVSGGVSAMGAG